MELVAPPLISTDAVCQLNQ